MGHEWINIVRPSTRWLRALRSGRGKISDGTKNLRLILKSTRSAALARWKASCLPGLRRSYAFLL